MRYVTKGRWSAFSTNDVLPVVGQTTTVKLRADGRIKVYLSGTADFVEEMLVGYGEGEIECEMHGLGYGGFIRVSLAKSTRCWIWRSVADQEVLAMSDEVFATLDRPEPISPEMREVQRMLKANAMKFEAMRNEMVRLQNANSERSSKTAKARADGKGRSTATTDEGRNEDRGVGDGNGRKSLETTETEAQEDADDSQ